MHLNLARTLPQSAVNGPGERFVVWTQGCSMACPGCWNRDTWSFAHRNVCEVSDLAKQILATSNIEGVTFTGGEPFDQAAGLAEVACTVQGVGLSVFVFTGYNLDELSSPEHQVLLEHVDVVVTGRYTKDLRDLGLPWRSSQNQRVHFLTNRYGPTDMRVVPDVEVHISPDGSIVLTGFPPQELLKFSSDKPLKN